MIKRMVLVLCTAAAALAAVALSASPANAMPYIGISQSFQDFGKKNGVASKDILQSKYFVGLQPGSLRVIVPWDIAVRSPADPERLDFEQFLVRVRDLAGVGVNSEPYVVFGPTENQQNIVDGGIGWDINGYRAPTVAAFQTAIHQFVALYGPQGSLGLPRVRMIGAWNEPNREPFQMQLDGGPNTALPVLTHDGTQMNNPYCTAPATSNNCGPAAAAAYWKVVRDELDAVCLGSCYSVAGEFTSGFGATSQTYWDVYRAHIDTLINANYPKQISFHGHHDVDALGNNNDCVSGGSDNNCITAVFANWLASKVNTPWANRANMAIWNTEVHSFYQTTSGTPPAQYQLNRFKHLMELSDTYQVKRVYYFNFQAQGSDDYGLIAKGDLNAPGANRPIWWYLRERLTGNDMIGVFRPSNNTWYERNTISGPSSPFIYAFSWAKAVAGDWDGDGIDTAGVYDPGSSNWFLRNSNTTGPGDVAFTFGFSGAVPIVGDWDGDGIDTPGLYDPVTRNWYLRNSNSTGTHDITFTFGFAGVKPIVGDWDGNGTDTPGVFDPATRNWYLRNSNTTGGHDITFTFGFPGVLPVVGDYNSNNIDTPGVFDPATGNWYLRNSNTTGGGDLSSNWGINGDQPLAADWDGA